MSALWFRSVAMTVMICVVSSLRISRPGDVAVSPVEILSAYGCEGSSKPRRETHNCPSDGTTLITIRGRGFDNHQNEVFLEESPSFSVRSTQASKNQDAQLDSRNVKLSFGCAALSNSQFLPKQLLFCTLPSPSQIRNMLGAATPLDEQTLMGKKWFDVKVVAKNGQSGVLRRAVQINLAAQSSDADDEKKAGNGDDVQEADVMTQFDTNDWLALGIGGLEKQFKELFRRAFASRTSKASSIAHSIGVQHVRGVILHGPPGTGKTLIARTVAKLLHAKNVQIINGPEIMSKFVGESEKNLRALFTAADDDYSRNKEASGLHVLIFDEIDAVLRPRGEGDDSAARAVYDGVTTQMLAYMDGIHSRANVLIIGLTNRMDALDKALLRPGRFEVQIRVPLPDHEGRKQIFAIHTKALKSHRYLSPRINFDRLSAETSSFSGADIAGVSRSAISFAIQRLNQKSSSRDASQSTSSGDDIGATCSSPSPDDGVKVPCGPVPTSGGSDNEIDEELQKMSSFLVTEDDLMKGVKEVLNSKGSSANLSPFLANGVVLHSEDPSNALKKIASLVNMLRNSSKLRRVKAVLYGSPGSGATTLAALAARHSQFSFTHMITSDVLSGLTVQEKIKKITYAFETAAHVPSSFIVLDKIEDIIEMNLGRRPIDRITSELMTLIQKDDSVAGSATIDNAKSLILITTSKKEFADHFGSVLFDSTIHTRDLPSASIREILCAYGVASSVKELDQLISVMPSTMSLKRLMFLVHATYARDEGSSATDANSEGATQAEAPLKRTVRGDISRTLAWDEAEALSKVSCTASLKDMHSEDDRQKSVSATFVMVLKEFGHFIPRGGGAGGIEHTYFHL